MARAAAKKNTGKSVRESGRGAKAQQDVEEADSSVLRLPREAQIAFWQALANPPPPTEAQRRLGELVRSVT